MTATELGTPPGPARSGSTSQRLLVTLLGDYWFGRTVHIPSSALVALLGEFGVTEQAARAALSRVVRTGHLEGTKEGRRTSYRLSATSARQAVIYGRAIMRFTAARPDSERTAWDGRWTVVAYAIEVQEPDDRRRIRRRLRELGFAPLQDALWVCPRRRAQQACRVLHDLGIAGFTVLEGASTSEASALDPTMAFELDVVAETYRSLIADLEPSLARVSEGTVEPAEALLMRTMAMDPWRQMALLDPNLPVELLPPDWPGWEARRLFTGIYDGLGGLAEERVREVVAPFSPEAAEAVHHDTVANPR